MEPLRTLYSLSRCFRVGRRFLVSPPSTRAMQSRFLSDLIRRMVRKKLRVCLSIRSVRRAYGPRPVAHGCTDGLRRDTETRKGTERCPWGRCHFGTTRHVGNDGGESEKSHRTSPRSFGTTFNNSASQRLRRRPGISSDWPSIKPRRMGSG